LQENGAGNWQRLGYHPRQFAAPPANRPCRPFFKRLTMIEAAPGDTDCDLRVVANLHQAA
jgi:hypothetical protein